MFSSQEYVDNKTGKDDLSRFQYLQALVTEFQDTSSDGIFNTLYKCGSVMSCSQSLISSKIIKLIILTKTGHKKSVSPCFHGIIFSAFSVMSCG